MRIRESIRGWGRRIGVVLVIFGLLNGAVTEAQQLAPTFVPSITAATIGPSMRAADVDQSGRDDLIVWFPTPSIFMPTALVAVYADPGMNPMAALAATPLVVFTAGQAPNLTTIIDVFVADMDGDGRPDLLVQGKNVLFQTEFHLLRNLGGATFATPTLLATSTYINPMADVGDFDADGAAELFIWEGTQFSVFDLGAATPYIQAALNAVAAYWHCVGDFNGDGADDIIFDRAFTGTSAVIFSGQPGGAYPPLATAPYTLAPAAFLGMPDGVTGDFDGDGRCDLIVRRPLPSSPSSYAPWFYPGIAGPTLLGPPILLGNAASGPTIGELHAVDFDGDGALDLLDFTPPPVAGFIGPIGLRQVYFTSIPAFNVAGTLFESLTPTNFAYLGTLIPCSAFGDFDGDGDRDLILAQQIANYGAGFLLMRNRATDGIGTLGAAGIPELASGTPSVLNGAFNLNVTGAAAFAPGVLLPSLAEAAGPAGLLVDLSPNALISVNGGLLTFITDAQGTFGLATSLLGRNALIGLTVHFQAVIIDPSGQQSFNGINLAVTAVRTAVFH